MAKIPEQALITIRQKSGEMKDLIEEIVSLSNDVNTDTFMVGNFGFPFTESQRQLIIDRYNEIKTELGVLLSELP